MGGHNKDFLKDVALPRRRKMCIRVASGVFNSRVSAFASGGGQDVCEASALFFLLLKETPRAATL